MCQETIYIMIQIIRGTSINATLVGADEIDVATGRMSSENESARLTTDEHVVGHAVVSSRYSGQFTFNSVQAHDFLGEQILAETIAIHPTILVAGVYLLLVVKLLIANPPLHLSIKI